MNNVIFALCVLGGLGLVFGLPLTVASKVFHVEEDPRIGEVASCLNGANCGACGYAGCNAYAEAIVKDEAPLNLCAPGGAEALSRISAIMGEDGGDFVRMVAYVRCSGGDKAQQDIEPPGSVNVLSSILVVVKFLHYGAGGKKHRRQRHQNYFDFFH